MMADPLEDPRFYLAEDKSSSDTEDEIQRDLRASEFSGAYADNEALAYAITALIRYFDRHNEGVVSQTRFNKLIYILNNDLIRGNINIRLPYFWYLYGPVIPFDFLPEGLIQLLDRQWGKGIKITESRQFNLSENIRKRIDIAARNIYLTYGQFDASVMTKEVIHDVYEIAPYLFQKNYRLFQYQIKRKFRDRDILLKLGPLSVNKDIQNLDKLAHVYNKEEIPETYNDLLQWKLLVAYQLKNFFSIDGELLFHLLDSYWRIFCQALKIRSNNNLPRVLILNWTNKLPNDIRNYRIEFMRMEDKFYSDIYKSPNIVNAELYDAYNETVIRKLLGP